MQVGENKATELKELSGQLNIDFSELLLEYLVEEILRKIYKSQYREKIWLIYGTPMDFRKSGKRFDRIELLYKREERGQNLSLELVEKIVDKLVSDDRIGWKYSLKEKEGKIIIELSGTYKGMTTPVVITVCQTEDDNAIMEERVLQRLFPDKKPFSYYAYAPESQLVGDLYDIYYKLELVGDMGSYYRVNQIINDTTISGRHVLDELEKLTKSSPKLLNEKRIQQLKGYKTYNYMKKRWISYCKNNGKDLNADINQWENVVEKLVAFSAPIWTALCRNEIFFDDWMPELGRFLG